MAETKNQYAFRDGTCDGEIRFGNIDANQVKSSVLLRSGNPAFRKSHYMQFDDTGKLAGGTLNRCPGVYQIKCGDSPVEGVGFVLHSVNGDLIIGAPNGRIRMFAQDIDLIASGPGNDSGFINLRSNKKIEMKAPQITGEASIDIGLTAPKGVNITSSGVILLTGLLKCAEAQELTLNPPGTNTILDTVRGIRKLLSSLQ
jgi:hypothetical protein